MMLHRSSSRALKSKDLRGKLTKQPTKPPLLLTGLQTTSLISTYPCMLVIVSVLLWSLTVGPITAMTLLVCLRNQVLSTLWYYQTWQCTIPIYFNDFPLCSFLGCFHVFPQFTVKSNQTNHVGHPPCKKSKQLHNWLQSSMASSSIDAGRQNAQKTLCRLQLRWAAGSQKKPSGGIQA